MVLALSQDQGPQQNLVLGKKMLAALINKDLHTSIVILLSKQYIFYFMRKNTLKNPNDRYTNTHYVSKFGPPLGFHEYIITMSL